MIGHTLGASGALAIAASFMSLKEKVIPPTINTKELDESCVNMNLVTKMRDFDERKKYALANAFGFGGHNACIAIKSLDEGECV
jgi:3-oxoacyl-[acyl-carrier-protein] synthase II